MKRKMLAVGLLVLFCLGVLAVEVVSQPPLSPQQITAPEPAQRPPGSTYPAAPPAPPVLMSGTEANFSAVQPQPPEWTFEQLVQALKGIRARQKELQAQEADLLAKMEKKVEEKRQDLSTSQATLEQLRATGRVYPVKEKGLTKMEGKQG